ncbi:uncharacterized protein [Blastocystis hominis]|uniref:Uncharacterized protein n=1 Tax=Blastocystis hominis TaxID=12968 RepID=D8MBC9_BLAHO|nr:uncharacterized protein [Blastocystis hominis]CBK25368.2 unnamed protein product [Blastocystis hominis]|eukprot:XP_012899416.1 uncharacterized protein [Blastocystis hominis]
MRRTTVFTTSCSETCETQSIQRILLHFPSRRTIWKWPNLQFAARGTDRFCTCTRFLVDYCTMIVLMMKRFPNVSRSTRSRWRKPKKRKKWWNHVLWRKRLKSQKQQQKL